MFVRLCESKYYFSLSVIPLVDLLYLYNTNKYRNAYPGITNIRISEDRVLKDLLCTTLKRERVRESIVMLLLLLDHLLAYLRSHAFEWSRSEAFPSALMGTYYRQALDRILHTVSFTPVTSVTLSWRRYYHARHTRPTRVTYAWYLLHYCKISHLFHCRYYFTLK